MDVTIRDACTGDLPAILEILNDAVRDTTAVWSEEPSDLGKQAAWLEAKQAIGMPVLAALDGATLVGYAALSPFRGWPGYSRTVENSVYVATAARRRGVGRALIESLAERARVIGHHAMVAGIEAGNVASLELHRLCGFRHAGSLPEVGRKFGRWLDLTFMVRLLGIETERSSNGGTPRVGARSAGWAAGSVTSKNTTPGYAWGDGCEAWPLLASAALTVKHERMPSGASEKRHFHAASRQFFFVLSGTLDLEFAAGSVRLRRHEGLEVAPGTAHRAFNVCAEPAEFLLVSEPNTDGDRTEI